MADHVQYDWYRPVKGAVLKCSKIGWMGRLKARWCHKCGIRTDNAYKVYWEHVDLYRTQVCMETYCKVCAEAVVAAYELDRMVNGG